jgi:putative ABC transport system permease protein
MQWLGEVWRRLAFFFRRGRFQRDLEEEMADHVRMNAKDLTDEGMPPDEARNTARREFGNALLLRQRSRDAWGFAWLETLLQDLRYGLRQFRRNPEFTAVAVITLALGIGANTAIFTLIDAVMLRMLPVEKPAELFQLQYGYPGSGGASSTFSNPVWEQVRDLQHVFSGVFAWSNKDDFDLAQGGRVHTIDGIWVSGGFFSTLGLRPAAGRLTADSDDRRGCLAVAVLSYSFWQSHYGGAKGVIGSALSLGGHPVEVIGVAPPGFFGMDVGERFDLALPICATSIFDGKESRLDNGSVWWLNVAGRTNSKMNSEQLAARLRVLSPKIFTALLPPNSAPEERQAYSKIRLSAVPVGSGTSSLRGQFGEPLEVLMAVVGLVLLIACANIASLMLARGAARHKEVAARLALGASRMRLVRQLLTECLLLSSSGALLGVVFSRWCASLLVRTISTTQNTVSLNLSLDGRTFGFILAIAILTTFLFGPLPALSSTRISLTSTIKGSPASEAGRSSRLRGRKLIVASQVALSLILLVAAGLLLRSFVKLATLDIGFDRNNVLLVDVDLKTAKVPPERQLATYEEIKERLNVLPGVTSVGRSYITPITGHPFVTNGIRTGWANPLPLRGSPDLHDASAWVYLNYISAGYVPTLRMLLLVGRNFTSADMRSSQAIAIVDQTFARRFFPGLNPIGKSYLEGVPLPGFPTRRVEVVGLVKDFKYESLREQAHATAFLPINQLPSAFPRDKESFELRTALPPSALIGPVRAAVAGVSSAIPIEFHILADKVNDSLVQERLVALLSGFFGALALLLAMVGLYGTFNYLVTQRQTEFGIRMALGARPGSILGLVMRDLIAVLGGGLAAGIVISIAAARALHNMLFGLGPYDPTTILLAAGVLSAVALFAGYLPARRATKVDPMAALSGTNNSWRFQRHNEA